MRRTRRERAAAEALARTSATERAVEQGWRIHAALADWTGKVDAKASFALAIESIIVATIISLSGEGRRLSTLKGAPSQVMLWLGISILSLAILLAVAVVTPQLRSNQTAKNWREDFIYFGHLRLWSPTDLQERLRATEMLPVLTRQLVVMSKIAWRKHRYLQLSLLSAVVGALLVSLAGIVGSAAR